MKLVEVEWIDSVHGSGWENREVDDTPDMIIRTVGWIAQRTKRYLKIAASVNGANKQVCGVMSIPRVSIRRIRRIK